MFCESTSTECVLHIAVECTVSSFLIRAVCAASTVLYTVLSVASSAVLYCTECGIKRVHLTIGGCCAACSHGNSEQVQDTQLFQSLIMPILFSQLIIIILVISTTILSFNIYNISSAQVVMKVILTILTKFSSPSAASPLNVGFSREHQTGVSFQTSR